MSDVPAGLYYTEEHEWVQRIGEDRVRVGITDFAQSALGDVVFVQLPDAGVGVVAGETFGEVESTKSVSDLYGPISATVTAANPELTDNPALVNSEPYGAGWLVELKVDGGSDALDTALGGLLSSEDYQRTISG